MPGSAQVTTADVDGEAHIVLRLWRADLVQVRTRRCYAAAAVATTLFCMLLRACNCG
jgi:hypothetical protein